MELSGRIHKIGELQTFPSGFQKVELVVITEDQYPMPIAIEFLKDRSDLLIPFKEGERVKVSINIGGREWTSPTGEIKYFNSITGWKVERLDAEEEEPVEKGSRVHTATAAQAFMEEDEEDLPF